MILQLILVGLLLVLLFKSYKPEKGLPPGEFGIPILGVIPYLGGNLKDYFNSVKHKYGNIFTMKLGTRTAVFLRDFDTIKSHLTKPELSSRPDLYGLSFIHLFKDYGITINNGQPWERNRKITLRQLREFGFGKPCAMQQMILRESECLIQHLEKKIGEPFDIRQSFQFSVLNVIWSLVAAKTYDYGDNRIVELFEGMNQDTESMDGPINVLNLLPFLIPFTPSFVQNRWMNVSKIANYRKTLHKFLKETVEEHKATLNPSNPRDYIDGYLIELEDKNEISSTFEDPIFNLMSNMGDMFNAGTETIVNTLRWFILYMIAFPDVLKKIQDELDATIPMGQLPVLDDKEKLPYLQATVYEVMRHKTVVPFALTHAAEKDYYIDGYKIPKGALVFPCIEECHNDPKYWKRPEEFNPSRFLDEAGMFRMQKESFIPFSYGKRLCIGESLARMEIFMFAGALTQSFSFRLPEGKQPNLRPDDVIVGLNFPNTYEIILEKRRWRSRA